ncbi:hypothetical protein OS493_035736, partial [Desmophyllum pertusum]
MPGSDGKVASNYIKKYYLSSSKKKKYPLVLLKLIKRYAEDRIWADDTKEGERVLRFIVEVTKDRTDTSKMRK